MYSAHGLRATGGCEGCALKSEGFVCRLEKAALKAFDAISFITTYPDGATLFAEEEAPRGAFVLCKGRVKLTMTSSEGKTVILRIVKPGEVLGLHAVVSGKPYQAAAETMEPCQVNFVRRDDFLRFLSQHPEASIYAAQQLSESYQAACNTVRSLGLGRSASGKLARFLLDSSNAGQETAHGTRVRFTVTHEEIGQIIGTSRETVTRTLGEFRNKHLVAVNGSVLLIQNKTALESFVEV
jgi:CRP/FNR family transcriptional regulator, cyclic AMP receptor protein